MIRFILRALVAAAGLWVASQLLHSRGVTIGPDWQSLVVAGVVLGLVNAFVRPVVTLLTLPATILTLGLFLLIVNGLMVFATSWVMNHLLHLHMQINGWVNVVLVVIIVWAVSLVGNMLLGGKRISARVAAELAVLPKSLIERVDRLAAELGMNRSSFFGMAAHTELRRQAVVAGTFGPELRGKDRERKRGGG